MKGRPNYYSPRKEEYAHIKFDLDAGQFVSTNLQRPNLSVTLDFTSLFNWNTKQLFVWVLATYPSSESTATTPHTKAIIWDTIINSHSQSHPLNPFTLFIGSSTAPRQASKNKKSTAMKKKKLELEPGIIHLINTKPKYQITDISGVLSERSNVTLEVGWNIQPWVGALTWTLDEGQSIGRWHGVRGGKSKVFDMPALKGKNARSETIVGSRGSPKAAEASAVI